mgnify:CR=1 FL=1
MVERRDVLRVVGTVAIGTTLAGCSGSQDDGEEEEDGGESESSITEVDVGPEKRLRFEPEEVEISVDDTVQFIARSQGHNVTSHPDASPKCENPEGAEPFTSYEGESHFAIMEVGETFEHEFTVPGEYVYVCTPHAGQGMVGTIIVNE